ncbi:hypothetical protein B0H16DRAFT_1808433 [Mycena metata]|uniref:Uncharacterized protein n=1 Tax=Mycena metata TaxID=1033252 RepID=A0AAD7NIN7_9AGAR|nr:hypothetical protein B0H16DRAFT_1808433 [Mycena metata]
MPVKKSTSISITTTAADRAARLAKRASSAPAPETAAPTTPPQVSLPSVPEVATDVSAAPTEVEADKAQATIDVDAIDTPVSRMIVDTMVPATIGQTTQANNNTHSETIDVDALDTAASVPVQTTNTNTIAATTTSATTISTAIDPSGNTTVQTVSPPLNDYPYLPAPGQEIQSGPKGKGKEKAIEGVVTAADPYDPYPDIPTDGFEDFFDRPDSPDTAAATERAIALSLGQQPDKVTAGASTSRRPGEATPSSSPKRQRANTAGDSVPTSPRTSTPRTGGRIHNPTVERFANPHALPPVAPLGRPRYSTADGLPPRGSYTPTPEGGWHPLFGIDEESIWKAHPEVQHQFWDNEPYPKFLVIVSGGNGHRIQTRDTIATAVANFVNVDPKSIQVGTPGTAQGPNDARAWLIGGLAQHLADAILEQGALSCTEITLFAVPYSPPIAGFLGIMSGFTLRNTPAGAANAQEYIRSALAGDAAITQFVRAHRDSFPPTVDADGALEIFLASVGVHGVELLVNNTTTITAWNTYVVSPTESVAHFNHLRKLFASIVIHTSYAGEGKIVGLHHLPLYRPSHKPLPLPSRPWMDGCHPGHNLRPSRHQPHCPRRLEPRFPWGPHSRPWGTWEWARKWSWQPRRNRARSQ